ncbi:MAG TPA: radical SAM protein [Syntrophobacter fumaroxidans]|nr:radical SAM protein [Syntrophobacter fumaroxidans]
MDEIGRRLHITRLQSGGLITNYYCSSRCAHCLYACSPHWEKRYIDDETARMNLKKIVSLGCREIHVGGGEPLLDPRGLAAVLRTAAEEGVYVEYVETNSSWYRDHESAVEILTELKKNGLSTLLVSISPFHNEHIPFARVKGTIEACRSAGVSAFPWTADFYREIDALDDGIPHSIDEYARRFGADYLKMIPSRYWIHMGGRALKTFEDILGKREVGYLLSRNPRGCSELHDTSHFHLDLFGNYIPGLCSGLAIHRDDLGTELSPEDYPILTTLYASGIRGLLEIAEKRYGFSPGPGYLSKCHLCLEIRRCLVTGKHIESRELQPEGFYFNLD